MTLNVRTWSTTGRIKIEWAEGKIRDLETEITSFLKTNPYTLVREQDKETGETLVMVRVREQPPLRWGAIAGDAIHNLASALDILYALVYPGRRTNHFPFSDTADAHESRYRRKEKPGLQARNDLFRAAQAYRGGNEPLWLLLTVNNENKHGDLLPAFGRIAVTDWDFGRMLRLHAPDFPFDKFPPNALRLGIRWADPMCPVEDGAVVDRIKPGGVDMDAKFPLEIAFGRPEILKGKAIVPTLRQFLQATKGVEEAFVGAGYLN